MDLCYYNFVVFEAHHYYSRNYTSAIITLHMFEIRHYIRLETIWAQYQTYGVYRISVWTKLPISSSLSHSLTEGAQSSAFFPTTSLPLPLSSPSPALSELAGDGVERTAPSSAERAGVRLHRASRGAAARAGRRPPRASQATAGRVHR